MRIFHALLAGLYLIFLTPYPVIADDLPNQKLATVKRVDAPVIKQYVGRIEAVNKATMKSQTSGRLAEIYFDVNDIVKQGDVLARFRNERQKAELDLANAGLDEATADYDRSKSDFERYDNLYQQKLVAVTTLDQARATFKASKARLDSARARIKQAQEEYEYTIIRAPYSGIVTERHVEVGESVNPGSPIVSGISLNALRVVTEIPQHVIESVRIANQAKIYLAEGLVIDSTSITVFPFANELSHSFTVRADLPPADKQEKDVALYPGMLVKVGFTTGHQSLLLIPESALVHRGEINAVYVKAADNQVFMRQVRPGLPYDNNQRIIHAGLSAGEEIYLNPLAATALLKHQLSHQATQEQPADE